MNQDGTPLGRLFRSAARATPPPVPVLSAAEVRRLALARRQASAGGFSMVPLEWVRLGYAVAAGVVAMALAWAVFQERAEDRYSEAVFAGPEIYVAGNP